MIGFGRVLGLYPIKRNDSVEKFSFGANLEDSHYEILTKQINFIKEFKDQYNIEEEVNAYLFSLFNDISENEVNGDDILKFANIIDELNIPNLDSTLFIDNISYYDKRHKSISKLKERSTRKTEDTDSMKSIKKLLNLKDTYTNSEIENSIKQIHNKIFKYRIDCGYFSNILAKLSEAEIYTLTMIKINLFNNFENKFIKSFNKNLFDINKILSEDEINYLIFVYKNLCLNEFMGLFGNELNQWISSSCKENRANAYYSSRSM